MMIDPNSPQEQAALAALYRLGVAVGEPETVTAETPGSHTQCAYHLVHTQSGEPEDGGAASLILSLFRSETYPGVPADYTLCPVERPAEETATPEPWSLADLAAWQEPADIGADGSERCPEARQPVIEPGWVLRGLGVD